MCPIYNPPGGGISQLTGDVTAGPGSGSVADTLVATANVNTIIAANSPVVSVFGRTGIIAARTNDYAVAQVLGAAPLASPTFTGIPTAPTAANGTNTNQIATTAFVLANGGSNSVLATVSTFNLSTVAATNILTYTPTLFGNFEIGIYFTVIVATTNVTITVTYADANLGAQTLTLLNAVPEVVGAYTLTKFMIHCPAANAITITFTAGTANQVIASASIVQN